jgi:signal transduction histidine kinase
LDYARVRPPDARPVTVADLVDEALDQEVVPESIEICLDADPSLDAMIDAAQIQSALGNIIRNAIEAMPNGGTLRVGVRGRDGKVEITVADSGPGLLPEVADRLFEPLVTTKAEGSGLGLCTARNLIENQGGKIHHCAAATGGAQFVVELPLTS